MNNELYHYNHNHDRLGRFASGPGARLKSSRYMPTYKNIGDKKSKRTARKITRNLNRNNASLHYNLIASKENLNYAEEQKYYKERDLKKNNKRMYQYHDKWSKTYAERARSSFADAKNDYSYEKKLVENSKALGYKIQSENATRAISYGSYIYYPHNAKFYKVKIK